ncbi:hypothetical protein [Sphaerimonospora mesophila]
MPIAEQFTDIFRHREVRDRLLSLIRDFEAGDTAGTVRPRSIWPLSA